MKGSWAKLLERRVPVLLGLFQSLHLLAFALVMPLGPQFARTLHFSPFQFGLMSAAYPLAAGAAGFAALVFTRHLAGRGTLLWVGGGFVLGMLATASAPDFLSLVLARVATGAMGGLFCVWLPDTVSYVSPLEKRSRALKHTLATLPFWCLSLGLPTALFGAWERGWAAPFWVLAGIGAFGWAGLALFLPPIVRGPREQKAGARSMIILLRCPGYRSVFFLGCALNASAAVLVTFFSGVMVFNMGLAEAQLPLLFLAGGVLTLLALPAMEKLTEGFPAFPVFLGAASASAAAILVLAHLPAHRTGLGCLAGILFMVTNALRIVPATALVSGHLKPRHAERFMGLTAALQQGVAGAAMALGGMIMTRPPEGLLEGYDRLGWLALLALGVAVGMTWRRRKFRI